MSYGDFKFAFWHPIGPHSGESASQIIQRKRRQIEANQGWTLWSFQRRRMLKDWYQELAASAGSEVRVFCSMGDGSTDPGATPGNQGNLCKSFLFVNDEKTKWQAIPPEVKVLHPFPPDKTLASAFVVKRVIYPVEAFDRPGVEWYSLKKGPWRSEMVPTRGEYLIRPGGENLMRCAKVILELKPPYLAEVSSETVLNLKGSLV
jgi:hypothetical protein